MLMKIVRINDIYNYCKKYNIKMLSEFDADFWEVYVANNEYFDRLFRNSYREFVPFSIDDEQDLSDIATEFIFDVYAFLLENEKRYAELWRMQVLPDTDYSILDNYNVRESHNIQGSVNRTDTIGARIDSRSSSVSHGQQTVSETNNYTPGAKSEQDSETTEYGIDTTTTNTTLSVGAQSNTREEKVSADNVSTYSPKDYTEDNLGTRSDTTNETETRSAHSDTKSGSHTEQARTDNESKSITKGAQTDAISETDNIGSHSDTHASTEAEVKTVTRKGNIGVFSASKLLEEHRELWTAFSFYKLIFDEIANEFLRIVY